MVPVEKQVQVKTETVTVSRSSRYPSRCPLYQGSISVSWLLWDLDVPHSLHQGTTGTHQPSGTCMSDHGEGQMFNPYDLVIVRGEEGVGQQVAR